jgi:hypothetical protein
MGQSDDAALSKRSRASKPKEKAVRFNDSLFINYDLNDAEKAACKAWPMSEADVFHAMQEMIDDGYKFAFKYDAYSLAYSCFIQVAADGLPNSGKILTGRGSSTYKSVKQALYKHHVCLEGDWSAYAERRNSADMDD